MHPGRIEGATRVLGAPDGWDKTRDGPCGTLAILDKETDGMHLMASVWFPTQEEILALAAGAPVRLWIVGTEHPPVMIDTGRVPE